MNTLKLGKDFDETTRVHMYLRQVIAQNDDGTISLRRSNGRRRAGRPSFYYLRHADFTSKRFTADNDDEAVEIANRMAEGLETQEAQP